LLAYYCRFFHDVHVNKVTLITDEGAHLPEASLNETTAQPKLYCYEVLQISPYGTTRRPLYLAVMPTSTS